MAKGEPSVDVAGLQISNSTFSASPPGSLLVAENVVMPQKGVAEPRRGQSIETAIPAAGTPFQLAQFEGQTLVNYATTRLSTAYELAFSPAMTPLAGAPFNPVDDDGVSTRFGRMKFGFAASYLHFCTTTGPKVLETVAGAPRQSGLLQIPDPRWLFKTQAVAGNQAWLPYGSAVAYRTVLRRATSSGVSLLSPPSGRIVVSNALVIPPGGMTRAGGTTVTVTYPDGLTGVQLGIAATATFDISPGEADFPAGTETVDTTPTPTTFTYLDGGANVSNVDPQSLNFGRRAVRVVATLAPDAVAGDFVRLYRSKNTSVTNDDPSDELYLVGEVVLDAAAIVAGTVAIDDYTPESVLDDPLYANPQTGIDGALGANFMPPLYRDTANWGGMQFYVNTTGLQQLRLQMLGVGAPDGVQVDDTFTLAMAGFSDLVLTFKAAAGIATEVTVVSSSGLASVNIQSTSQNLVRALNLNFRTAAMPLLAYYESSQTQFGNILIATTTYDAPLFGITVSRPPSWTPALDTSTATNSQAERVLNGFAWSKPGQPEAVPVLNYSTAGSRNYPIRRGFGLRQAQLLFKAGDGIYSVTGAPPFNVQQISTANIIAPDCACVMDDAAWVYTDQGILRVSDAGGTTVVSRPIETELNRLRALFPNETRDWSFAVPYEQERRILFFVPFDVDTVTGRPQLKAWCYNVATQAWTGPLYEDVFSGIVNTDELRLKLGTWNDVWNGQLSTERNNQSWTDYADRAFEVSITNVDVGGDPLVIRLLVATGVEPGDGIQQGQWLTRIKKARPDLGARYFELYEDIPLTAAGATVYVHYDVTVQFQPQGNPSVRKALTRLAWLFKPEWFASLTAKTLVRTDQIQADLEIATPSPGFGLTPFGQGPFGNPSPLVVDVNPIDPKWTNAAQFFVGLRTSEVWMKMRLQGFVLELDGAAGPVGRGR